MARVARSVVRTGPWCVIRLRYYLLAEKSVVYFAPQTSKLAPVLGQSRPSALHAERDGRDQNAHQQNGSITR